MKGQYALNRGTGRLHAISCCHVSDTMRYDVSFSVEELLMNHPKKAVCCKHCLKQDEKAQKLVDEHNGKL